MDQNHLLTDDYLYPFLINNDRWILWLNDPNGMNPERQVPFAMEIIRISDTVLTVRSPCVSRTFLSKTELLTTLFTIGFYQNTMTGSTIRFGG